MEDMVKNNSTQESGKDGQQEPGKTFMQEEVNRIVSDRVNRAKKETGGTQGLEEREKELERKELAMQAKEILIDKGLPKELADILYFTDRESLNKAVEMLEKHVLSRNSSEAQGFMPLPGGQLPRGHGPGKVDPTRRVFGLE